MIRGAIYGLTAAAIWGGMYVVTDVVLEVIPPFTLLVLRLILGATGLAFVLWRKPIRELPAWPDLPRLLGVGLIGFGLSVGAQFIGTEKSTAVNGALVTSSSPAFIVLFAALLLHEKLTLKRIGAIALATVGVIVIVNPTQASFSSETFWGDVALAIAALTWGLYSVLVRQVSARFDTLVVTLFAFLGGLLLAIPASGLELARSMLGRIDGGIIAGVLYVGVISTAVAMWLWNRSLALVDASVAALFVFAQPLVGALLGIILLDQQMTPSLWIGGLLIVLGVLFSLTQSNAT